MCDSEGSSDQDLLEGVLAFQLGFASRQEFVAAVTRWLDDDSQRLGVILERSEVVSAEQRALLGSLAALHLRRHGGKLHRSLAALESSFSLRGELRKLRRARGEDSFEFPSMTPAILGSLMAEPADAPPAEGAGETAGAPASLDDAACCVGAESRSNRARFRVLHTFAEGSLGCVSVGRDEELQRDVAIKEMKPQFAHDPASRSRFALEAEITQALEHPGITPVYGIGHYQDGRPFYAMRLVRGMTMKQAILEYHGLAPQGGASGTADVTSKGSPPRKKKSRDFYRLEFRKLLDRLIHVCHAMEFAHRRGVLHRDLKPSNIMLGEHGDTVVVDWGLAKVAGKPEPWHEELDLAEPLHSGSGSMTQVGAVIGTPAYMSPEQAAGARETLGVETDIYGIGATLYHLLTGQSPLPKQPLREMLSRVQRGEITPVRKVNPGVPRPLAAICRKAMALQPSDRYRSTAELGDELERWLADEPITAYDEGQWVKSARWVRHNMATYTLSLLVFLSVFIIGLAARCRQLENYNELLRLELAAEDRVPGRTDAVGPSVAAAERESIATPPSAE